VKGRLLAVVAVVAVTGAGTAVAANRPAPSASRTAAQRMPLPATGVAAVPICPGPETLVAPPGGETVTPQGPVAVSALVQGRTAVLGDHPLVPGSSGLGLVTVPRTVAGSIALQARPAPAGTADAGPSMSLVQLGLARTGDTRGIAALACSTASTESWLVGGGTQVGRRGRLLLANPAPTAATVDVTLLGPRGVVPAPGAGGVVVPGRRQVALFVDALAPDLAVVAVHVQTRSGRVSAVLHDSWVRGTTAGGVDDVTAAAPAARIQFVPGVSVAPATGTALPAHATDPGAVAVRVVNPGDDVAVARVHLVGSGPPVTLPGGVVTVPARSVVDVPVTGVATGVYTAVVEADAPVVAGAVVGRGSAGSEAAGTAEAATLAGVPPAEFGWAASVEPGTTPALVALPSVTEDGSATEVTATLSVTAPGRAAEVEVTQLDGRGTVLRTATLPVPAGSAAEQKLDAAAAGLRLRPAGAGAPVVAAVVLSVPDAAGPLVSVLPVRWGPAGGGSRPAVVADGRVGLRG
jgi:Family of unknown function (DUF5719)